PDGLLLHEFDAPLTEPLGDLAFVLGLSLGPLSASHGDLDLDLQRERLAAGGGVGGFEHATALLFRSVRPAPAHRFALALAEVFRIELGPREAKGFAARARTYASPAEVVRYRPAADAEHGAELLRALAGQVEADEVVSLSVRQFSGHVYDLQTAGGWYISNNIISHNCRPWEGKVLSLTGRTPGYSTVAEARAAGLFHP